MIVEKILKELTPERIKNEINGVRDVRLPQEIQKWVEKYCNKIGKRNPLVWPLIFKFIETVNFSSVPVKYQHSLIKARFLSAMLVVLVDDIVDNTKNKKLREKLLNIPLEEKNQQPIDLSLKDRLYLDFALSVWQDFLKESKIYPRHKALEEILSFDILQIFNSMRFSSLINDNPCLINIDEYWGYSPSSMQLMVHHTLNAMCSDKFDMKEIGTIRKIVWHAQYMLRIGNCLGTWQRELKEKEYSNGIFAYLVDKKIINIESIIKKDVLIDKKNIKPVEEYFLKEWEKHYNYINDLSPKVKSFSIKKFLSQLKKIFILHLSIKNI